MARLPDLTVTLTLDTSRLEAALASFREGMMQMAEAMSRSTGRIACALATIGPALRKVANDERRVAGLCSRYYVRASMSAEYGGEEALGTLVAAILRAPETLPAAEPTDALLTAQSRAQVAASAIRGYVEHRDRQEAGPLIWHRYMAGHRVVLSGTTLTIEKEQTCGP